MSFSSDHEGPTIHTFREELRLLLREELRDQEAVSHELAVSVLTRLVSWAKLFGLVLGIPATLIVVLLTILGIREYSDLRERMEVASDEVGSLEEKTQVLGGKAQSLESELRDTRGRLARVSRLENDVSRLRSDLRVVRQALKVEPSEFLTPQREEILEREASSFGEFLSGLGFGLASEPPTAVICSSGEETCSAANAYFSLADRKIVVGEEAAEDVEAYLHSYSMFAVFEEWPSLSNLPSVQLQASISGLADYLTCSYMGDPLLGEILASGKTHSGSGRNPWLRNLLDADSFSEHREFVGTGGVWASILWRVRQEVGRENADLLAYSWIVSIAEGPGTHSTREDLAQLLQEAAQQIDGVTSAVVHAELKKRGADEGVPGE